MTITVGAFCFAAGGLINNPPKEFDTLTPANTLPARDGNKQCCTIASHRTRQESSERLRTRWRQAHTLPHHACDTPPHDLPRCPTITNSHTMRAVSSGEHTQEAIIYALLKSDGSWVTSTRTGSRMVWSERRLARMAAQHLAKKYGQLKAVEA